MMMPKYPRSCEVWEDLDTGATFLVPVDCKGQILKAKSVRNIECMAEFLAQDKLDMMETFYLITGRGEYKPPKVSHAKDRAIDIKSVNNKSNHSDTTKSDIPKLDIIEVIRDTLNIYGPENYRRERRAELFR